MNIEIKITKPIDTPEDLIPLLEVIDQLLPLSYSEGDTKSYTYYYKTVSVSVTVIGLIRRVS